MSGTSQNTLKSREINNIMKNNNLLTVLLVEDDPDDAELIQELLSDEKDYSFKIQWVTRLEKALNSLSTALYDVILLDLSLPDSFGLQTVVEIYKKAPAVPLVVLTGLDDDAAAIDVMRQGAQDYVLKGKISGSILVRIMRYAIERNKLLVELEHRRQDQLKMAEQLRLMEKKDMERQIAEQKQAIEIKSLKAVEKKAKELERSNAELEQFAYVASHDLQEPLRSITGYLQLLQRRYSAQLDEDANTFISRSVAATNRMGILIKDLLNYSRVQRKGKPFKDTDLSKVLHLVLNNLHSTIEDTHGVITHDPLPIVYADSTQVVQLFQNLISNAIKFKGTEPPKIHIGAQKYQESGEWVFSVKDNGIGIENEYIERIFLIFQRLHGIREYEGTGIGLALCKKIVERHGGRIWVESEPDKGSTFSFTITQKQENTCDESETL